VIVQGKRKKYSTWLTDWIYSVNSDIYHLTLCNPTEPQTDDMCLLKTLFPGIYGEDATRNMVVCCITCHKTTE
jgi:hypothetical protein